MAEFPATSVAVKENVCAPCPGALNVYCSVGVCSAPKKNKYGPQKKTPEPSLPSARSGSLQLNCTVTLAGWFFFVGGVTVMDAMWGTGLLMSIFTGHVLNFAQLTLGLLLARKFSSSVLAQSVAKSAADNALRLARTRKRG